ncbi:hypothetical protein KKE60_04500, partial [Patescibacteria group bacterium]|nr:hypothetical protein [Patescibacteria group bacterium]
RSLHVFTTFAVHFLGASINFVCHGLIAFSYEHLLFSRRHSIDDNAPSLSQADALREEVYLMMAIVA